MNPSPRPSTLLTAAMGCLLLGGAQTSGLWAAAPDVPEPPTAAATPSPAATAPGSPTPAPRWLGDPGVDIGKARARARERYETARSWEIEHSLAAYDSAGKKDPRWDADARETIRGASNSDPEYPGAAAAMRAEKSASARAVANGCDDPLINYLWLRTNNYPPDISRDKLARLYTEAEAKMAASGYPPLRKFFAAVRAIQQDMPGRRAVSGTIGLPKIGNMEPAASWPVNTDIKTACQHALTQLETLLDDPDVPPSLYYDATKELFEVASADPVGRAEVLLPLERFYTGSAPKRQRPAVAKMFEGRFWTEYAWDIRGPRGSQMLEPDETRRYTERLDKALALLEEAWKLDPTESEIARNMIFASGSNRRPYPELEKWFRRAMNARPNDYAAALAYLMFIEPRWGGKKETMLEFGHRCWETQDAPSRMPMILLDVHTRLSKISDNQAAYWRQPDVWADLRKVFDLAIKAQPDQTGYRTDYAIYAWRAKDWRIAHDLFERVGDTPDPRVLKSKECSPEQFQEMRREAAERANGGGEIGNGGSV